MDKSDDDGKEVAWARQQQQPAPDLQPYKIERTLTVERQLPPPPGDHHQAQKR
jgi:hypothetical protein